MTLFDRSRNVSSYWYSIVTMAQYCIVFEIERDTGRKTPIVHRPSI